ncbi:MAG: DUF1249 domain-containing protein [Gammaproteobacteria bacterium]|nr:DUF1249 domain-containing protein [Gammaproteobacteria bacterium]
MLIDTGQSRLDWVKPRSFKGLMALYESNYRRLGKLLGNRRALPDEAVSAVRDDLDLHLRVEEQTPYTTTFRLTYRFGEDGSGEADPDLQVRIYHDVQVAEVLSCKPTHRHHMLKRFDARGQNELASRWQRNLLLNKWLEYCLERGHSFDF